MESIGIKGTMEELCVRDDVKKIILDDILATGKAAGLFSFEQARLILMMISYYLILGKGYLSGM